MNTTLNTSCLENLILQNGKPQMYRFAGGYDSFDADTIDGYPFDLRPIPFDRFYARAPLAEKYYSISPYAYCAGDPVNCIDPDGRDTYGLDSRGYFYPIKIDGKEELRIIRIGNKTAAPFVTKSTCLKNAVCQMAVPSPPPAHKICNINGKQDRSGRWIHDAVTKCKSILYLYKWILETGPGVEWRVDTFGKNYLLATQHSEQSINSINGLFPGTEEEMKTTDMHNHLENGTTGGSDTGEQGNLQNDHSPMVAYYVAVPGKDGVVHVYRYNQGGENGNTDMGTIDDFVKNFNPDNQ